MTHKNLDPSFPPPPYGDSEFPPRTSSRFGGGYEDLFKSLDTQPVLNRPLFHPGTGLPLTPTTPSSTHCPTFRPPRPRTPKANCPPSPRSATLSSEPLSTIPSASPMPPSPLSPLKTSYSTPSISTMGGVKPIYSPSRSSSTRSNFTFKSTTTASASRSSSTTSRHSAARKASRPGPCPLPAQPGRHNSLAELHARQVNNATVVQPISPYAEELNPLERMGYAMSGIVRRKSSGVEMRGREDEERGMGTGMGLRKKSSFARLGWGQGSGVSVEGERRGSAPAVDVSRNF